MYNFEEIIDKSVLNSLFITARSRWNKTAFARVTKDLNGIISIELSKLSEVSRISDNKILECHCVLYIKYLTFYFESPKKTCCSHFYKAYSVTTRNYAISWYKVVDQNQYEFEYLAWTGFERFKGISQFKGLNIIVNSIVNNIVRRICAVLTVGSVTAEVDALTGLVRTKRVCRLRGLSSTQSPTIVVDLWNKTICCFISRFERFNEPLEFAKLIFGIDICIIPDHSWSSYRNCNEVKYAWHQLDNDYKRRVLFDKPIVWSVTQLVPSMDQLLSDPGT